MSKFLLALGAAALAFSAPALADKEGKGQGGGNKGGQQQKADRGNGGNGGKDRGNKPMKFDRGDRGPVAYVGGGRGNGDDRRAYKVRGNGREDARVRIVDRRDRDDYRDDNVRLVARGFDDDFGNCPPGLAKKGNGCMPPGQAKKYLGSRIQQAYLDRRLPYQYRSWYRDDDNHLYRYGDDYIYRVSRSNNLIDGIIPLFGAGYYAVGDPWPEPYDFYNVPYQYRDYYADTSDYRYRYGDGAIYRINSGSGVVDGIVALLAGDLGVGSRLPLGYDTYNVPFAYRERYYDSDQYWYRYNDGYIYQVDPKTRLIEAVIQALV